MKGRTYRYMENAAQFPFGYGLGYSEFEILDVKMPEECTEDELNDVCVKLDLRNKGCFDGAQVIQIYVASGEKGAPKYQLKAFKKVFLKAGEKTEVSVPLSRDSFEIVNEKGEFFVNKGKKYTVYVGCSQPDNESEKLLGTKPVAKDFIVK